MGHRTGTQDANDNNTWETVFIIVIFKKTTSSDHQAHNDLNREIVTTVQINVNSIYSFSQTC